LIWISLKIEQYEEGEVEQTQRLELDSIEEVKINATLQSA
jgi:DNA-directed RNA polymerase beta' subunit